MANHERWKYGDVLKRPDSDFGEPDARVMFVAWAGETDPSGDRYFIATVLSKEANTQSQGFCGPGFWASWWALVDD